MRPSVRTIAVVLASALASALAVSGSVPAATVAHALPLRTVARVPLSGPSVRFDYTSLDPTTNELWISHMNASQLLAFDVRTRKIVKTIPAPGVHGVIAVPALGRVFASATDAREVDDDQREDGRGPGARARRRLSRRARLRPRRAPRLRLRRDAAASRP